MKFIFKMSAALLLGFLVSRCRPAEPPRAIPSDSSDVARLVGLLDYVAADYGRAVQKGRLVDAAEYEEQLQFTEDAKAVLHRILTARALSREAGTDPLTRDLEALAELVATRRDAELVSAGCHSLKTAVVERFGLR